jgi:hypothetical protein
MQADPEALWDEVGTVLSGTPFLEFPRFADGV